MALVPPMQPMGMDVEGGMGMGMGMGMDMGDDMMAAPDMELAPAPSRPWLSTTSILLLFGIFLITLCGIVGFIVFLSVLKARSQGPSEAPDPATLPVDEEAAGFVPFPSILGKPTPRLDLFVAKVTQALAKSSGHFPLT